MNNAYELGYKDAEADGAEALRKMRESRDYWLESRDFWREQVREEEKVSSGLRAELAAAIGRIVSLTEERDGMGTLLSTVSQNNERLRSENFLLSSALAQLEARIESLREDRHALESTLEEVQEQRDHLAHTVAGLEEQLAGLTLELEQTRRERDDEAYQRAYWTDSAAWWRTRLQELRAKVGPLV